MSRHKHKNPRLKVYFQYKGRYFRLLEAINFGTKTTPELKIKGLAETICRVELAEERVDQKMYTQNEGSIIADLVQLTILPNVYVDRKEEFLQYVKSIVKEYKQKQL